MDTTGCLNRERIADQTREASDSSCCFRLAERAWFTKLPLFVPGPSRWHVLGRGMCERTRLPTPPGPISNSGGLGLALF